MPKRTTRELKYPDTDTFHFSNVNPKNRITGDCTFRAISLATGKPWNEVVMGMAEMSCRTGYAINDKKGIERYLAQEGWTKHQQPRKFDGTKYTGKDFVLDVVQERFNGRPIILLIGTHHVTCVHNNRIVDIWDCTDGCVGNYWTKEASC